MFKRLLTERLKQRTIKKQVKYQGFSWHERSTGGWPGKGDSNSWSKQLQWEETWELLLLLSCCLPPRTGLCSPKCPFPHQKMTQPQTAGPLHKHLFIDIRKSYRYRLCTKPTKVNFLTWLQEFKTVRLVWTVWPFSWSWSCSPQAGHLSALLQVLPYRETHNAGS